MELISPTMKLKFAQRWAFQKFLLMVMVTMNAESALKLPTGSTSKIEISHSLTKVSNLELFGAN